METIHGARWFDRGDDKGFYRCRLCPRACKVSEGTPGYCHIRRVQDGRPVTTGYGLTTGFAIDPIEKKPLNHFYPGSSILSFGTAGCNLGCRFCQNWTSSKAEQSSLRGVCASPQDLWELALEKGVPAIAFTYNDPVIFAEFAIDVAQLAHEAGLRTVAVTAGYISPGAREEFFAHMDAANVDLKSMEPAFYKKMCGAQLQPVLETLEYLAQETQVWVEVTNLIIPGHNDSEGDLVALSTWIAEHMGVETPVHFSAFHPDFELVDLPRTPPATLSRARELALAQGLKHVFTGNVHDAQGQSSYCAGCGQQVIGRQWYQISDYRLDAQGCCSNCGDSMAGRFGSRAGP